MKNIVTFIFLLVATGAMAQKVKSQFVNDSIVMPNTFKEIRPIVMTPHGDTARSVYWLWEVLAEI